METRRARAVGFRSVLHEALCCEDDFDYAAKSCTCLGDGALARWSQRVRVNSSQHTVVMKDGTSIDANQLLDFIRAYGGEIFA